MKDDMKKKGGFALTIAAGLPKGMGKKSPMSDEKDMDDDMPEEKDDMGGEEDADMEKAGDALADALDSGARGKALIEALREAMTYC